jgi:hypothetical protein
VPPLATATVPVTLAAVPVVFWLSVGNVQLAKLPEAGVPNAPPLVTNAPAEPTATPRAVATLVPGVVVARAVSPRLVLAVLTLATSLKLLAFTIAPESVAAALDALVAAAVALDAALVALVAAADAELDALVADVLAADAELDALVA